MIVLMIHDGKLNYVGSMIPRYDIFNYFFVRRPTQLVVFPDGGRGYLVEMSSQVKRLWAMLEERGIPRDWYATECPRLSLKATCIAISELATAFGKSTRWAQSSVLMDAVLNYYQQLEMGVGMLEALPSEANSADFVIVHSMLNIQVDEFTYMDPSGNIANYPIDILNMKQPPFVHVSVDEQMDAWLEKVAAENPHKSVEEVESLLEDLVITGARLEPPSEADRVMQQVDPSHYKGYFEEKEWIEVMEGIPTMKNPDVFAGALELQIRKYLDRRGGKDVDVQELKKALFYLAYMIRYIEGKPSASKGIKAWMRGLDEV